MTKEEIIKQLRNQKEIKPDQYDGSYKLVRETVKALKNTNQTDLDYKDLNMLYLMTVGTWKSSIDNKKEKINDSNLTEEDKRELIVVLDRVDEKSEEGYYSSDNIGMFGTGFYTFKKSGNAPSNQDIQKIINMCIEILNEDNEDKCIEYADDYLDEDVYGLGTASLSQILHCLKPFYFPVLNSVGIELYKKLGVDLENPDDIRYFAKNTWKIKEFRDEEFTFKNYRVIDHFVELEDLKKEQEDREKNKIKDIDEKLMIDDIQKFEATDKDDTLVEPFKNIFQNKEEAYWFFDILRSIVDSLGITNSTDDRLVISLTENKRKIRLNFCSWAIFEIFTRTETNRKINAAFLEEAVDLDEDYASFNFSQNEDEPDIKSYSLAIKDFKDSEAEFRSILQETLEYIKKRFTTYKSSPHESSYHKKLAPAIFDREILDEILIEGLEKEISSEQNYFWITANPKMWTIDGLKQKEETFSPIYNDQGNKRRISSAFQNAKAGDKIIYYESSPTQAILGVGEVIEGVHKEEVEDGPKEGITIAHTRDINPIPWEKLSSLEELRNCSPIKSKAQGSIFEITKEEYKSILALEELGKEEEIPTVDFGQEVEIENLYFSERKRILQRVQAALKNGKHIILTGPPGTGKSKLAKEICESYVSDYQMVTANSNWSTFDTIGGYQPNKDNELSFNSGVFLDCFKKRDNTLKNQWLIIDEINRADIDKAFGSLFSALTGDEITLSFKAENDKNVVVKPQDNKEVLTTEHEYIIPDDWRLIATMNTLDKTSLYEMSYAFMRRFAFIPISIPKDIKPKLIESYLDCWGIDNKNYIEQVAKLWTKINDVRKIGPAIVEDMYNYLVETGGDYISVLIMYVLPQFEGVRSQKLNQFIDDVVKLNFIEDEEALRDFAADYFMLEV